MGTATQRKVSTVSSSQSLGNPCSHLREMQPTAPAGSRLWFKSCHAVHESGSNEFFLPDFKEKLRGSGDLWEGQDPRTEVVKCGLSCNGDLQGDRDGLNVDCRLKRIYEWRPLKRRVTWAENSQSMWPGCSSPQKLPSCPRQPLSQQRSEGFHVCNAGFQSCFRPIPPCSVRSPVFVETGILISSWCRSYVKYFHFYSWLQFRAALNLERDVEFWLLNNFEAANILVTLWGGLNKFFMMVMSLWPMPRILCFENQMSLTGPQMFFVEGVGILKGQIYLGMLMGLKAVLPWSSPCSTLSTTRWQASSARSVPQAQN